MKKYCNQGVAQGGIITEKNSGWKWYCCPDRGRWNFRYWFVPLCRIIGVWRGRKSVFTWRKMEHKQPIKKLDRDKYLAVLMMILKAVLDR